MRRKYLEERAPLWYEFGVRHEHQDSRLSLVDVTDGTEDVLEAVRRDLAERVMAAHNRQVDAVIDYALYMIETCETEAEGLTARAERAEAALEARRELDAMDRDARAAAETAR